MFNKDRVNLRRNSNKMYVSVISFIFLGLTFFLTSGFIFKEKIEVLSSPINEEIKVSSTENIKVMKWIHDEDKHQMEVVIDTNNLENEYESIEFTSFQRSDGSELKTEVAYKYEDYFVVRVKGLARNYTQIAFDVIGEVKEKNNKETAQEDEEANKEKTIIKTLYADYRKVNKGNIIDRNENEYIAYATDLIIKNVEKNIEDTKHEIEENNKEIDELHNRVNDLEEERVYQTDEEKLETDNIINGLKIQINELKNRNKTLERELKQYREKIEKTHRKEREMILELTE